jgi:omega-6 fatty acid desaturase (delta-12 desaturase)
LIRSRGESLPDRQQELPWTYPESALCGSSHVRLPRVLQFFTGNIGLHHVHHLNARIPNYNLRRAHDENAVFDGVRELGLREALLAFRLKLYDERSGRLVTFARARRPSAAAHPSTRPAASPR